LLSDTSPNAPILTAWQVFLSSTITDFESYRREVQEVLLTKAETVVFLSEDWPGGYDDTVKKCRARVEGSSGFFLMMGYWYGSIPTGCDKSITHFEFEWALGKWGQQPFPPLAVFMPKPQSSADKELREAARTLIEGKKDLDPQKHEALLETFRTAVMGSWRTVRSFEDIHDLREYALASCLMWKGQTPQAAAARGNVEGSPSGSKLTEEQLGLLGREKQFDAARRVLSSIEASPDIPAGCLLVSGPEDAGHRAFVAALLKTKSFRAIRPAKLGRPGSTSYDTELVTQWVAKVLGLPGSTDLKGPGELAERVVEELKRQPLCFALDQVNRFPGGVPAFRDSFWQPFYDRLKELREVRLVSNQLVAIVAEYTSDSSGWATAVCEPDAAGEAGDPSKLLLLPSLASFTKGDVLLWLAEIGVPKDRRAQVAKNVLLDGKGESDPTPLRVFDRLRGENLQPEDDE